MTLLMKAPEIHAPKHRNRSEGQSENLTKKSKTKDVIYKTKNIKMTGQIKCRSNKTKDIKNTKSSI